MVMHLVAVTDVKAVLGDPHYSEANKCLYVYGTFINNLNPLTKARSEK